jgi:hypothetical protein
MGAKLSGVTKRSRIKKLANEAATKTRHPIASKRNVYLRLGIAAPTVRRIEVTVHCERVCIS